MSWHVIKNTLNLKIIFNHSNCPTCIYGCNHEDCRCNQLFHSSKVPVSEEKEAPTRITWRASAAYGRA